MDMNSENEDSQRHTILKKTSKSHKRRRLRQTTPETPSEVVDIDEDNMRDIEEVTVSSRATSVAYDACSSEAELHDASGQGESEVCTLLRSNC